MSAFTTLFDLVSLEDGDGVVIVSDSRSDESVARFAFETALARGADAIWSSVRPRDRNGDELPQAVRASIRESDLVLLLTSWSPSHSAGVVEAMARGARVVSMPGITADLIARGAANADYGRVKTLTDRFGDHLAAGRTISVSTRLGTSFEAELGGWRRVPLLDGGPLPRGVGGLGNFPAGESAISPIEGTTNGRIVVDLTTSTTRAPLREHIVLTVVDGIVVEIEGGPEADTLRTFLAEVGPSAHVVAEIAVGTNDRALHVGVVLEDEKKLGTAHVGLGNARAFGGLNESPVHVDVIFDGATVTVDGVDLLVDGEVTEVVQRREPLDAFSGRGGTFRRSRLETDVRDGRLFVSWPDARGVPIWSQVGDDEAARRAVTALAEGRFASSASGTDEARVLDLLERYRVVVADASEAAGGPTRAGASSVEVT